MNIQLFLLFRSTSLVSLLFAAFPNNCNARNSAITSDSVAIATLASGGRGLVTYDANRSIQTIHNFPQLANMVSGFDDVAVDPAARARSSDEPTFVFALSANSRRVCSFELELKRRRIFLNQIGCATTQIRTSPYAGLSAIGGSLVVSGGTGGVSIFIYDTTSGVISNSPVVRDQDLGDVGHPDVTLVTPNLVALSTDLRQGFGVTMASFNGRNLQKSRTFRVQNSNGFKHAIRPSNFPLVSSVYYERERRGGGTYLYVANGSMTVQDPTRNGSPTVIKSVPDEFEALTVDVNSQARVAIFGGVVNQGATSAFVILDITRPLNPTFVVMEEISDDGGGRITSVASSGNNVLYVREGVEGIGHSWALKNALEGGEIDSIDDNIDESTILPNNPTSSGANTSVNIMLLLNAVFVVWFI